MICHRRRISIHAPHEGERLEVPDFDDNRWNISIHAPHEGERLLDPDWPGWDDVFQSTLPTRGSDILWCTRSQARMHFNPRSPRGGATTSFLAKSVALLFQSTLPTRGSDLWQRFSAYICRANFNPRSPRGGATCAGREFCGHLAGFQSTLPTRGSDIIAKSTIRAKIQFQSTLPTRGSDAAMPP